MQNNEYPCMSNAICVDCAIARGGSPSDRVSTWWQDICAFCGKPENVTATRTYGINRQTDEEHDRIIAEHAFR